MEIGQVSISSCNERFIDFIAVHLVTRNNYYLDWNFESFPSLLVRRVGFSIIWHLQTDNLEGLGRELVTTQATYYQVWPTFPWPQIRSGDWKFWHPLAKESKSERHKKCMLQSWNEPMLELANVWDNETDYLSLLRLQNFIRNFDTWTYQAVRSMIKITIYLKKMPCPLHSWKQKLQFLLSILDFLLA